MLVLPTTKKKNLRLSLTCFKVCFARIRQSNLPPAQAMSSLSLLRGAGSAACVVATHALASAQAGPDPLLHIGVGRGGKNKEEEDNQPQQPPPGQRLAACPRLGIAVVASVSGLDCFDLDGVAPVTTTATTTPAADSTADEGGESGDDDTIKCRMPFMGRLPAAVGGAASGWAMPTCVHCFNDGAG